VRVLAIVPARGGSKGIPRKNIALLAGRPLISYTLNAARAAKTITDLMISTDDEEIASICETHGVPVPYRRPPELSDDTAGMAETALDSLDWWAMRQGDEPDLVVVLQPTSPLRNANDIDGTVSALRKTSRQSATSVHEVTEHPMECVKFADGRWTMLVQPPSGVTRRQGYQGQFYFINGAVYAATPSFLRQQRAFVAEGAETTLYVMDAVRGVDIDDETDLDLAEAILGHPRLRLRL